MANVQLENPTPFDRVIRQGACVAVLEQLNLDKTSDDDIRHPSDFQVISDGAASAESGVMAS